MTVPEVSPGASREPVNQRQKTFRVQERTMRKLRLDLEALTVESFATERGEVLGRESTAATDCGACDQCNTDAITCNSAGWRKNCVWEPPYTMETCASCPTCAYC